MVRWNPNYSDTVLPYGKDGSFSKFSDELSTDSKICNISAGVTMNGSLGKCLVFPVIRYESSIDKVTS